MQRSISVVIPNYNGKDLLQKNIPSVYAALGKINCDFEIIIVDDASSDASVSFLRENFKDIIVIVNESNRGFSPTINRGIFAAKKDLVFLLNSDVALSLDYFEPLLDYFKCDDTFGVSGRFVEMSTNQIQDAGKFPQILSSKKIQPFNFFVEDSKVPVPTLFVSGGGSLVDRKKIIQLRGFNEMYAPFYFEDTDLSLRALELGWKCYYEHKAVCLHATTSTIKKFHKSRRVWIVAQRNKLILHEFHLSARSKFFWNSRQIFTLIIQLFFFRWKYHQAFWDYLGKRKEIRRAKRQFVKELQPKYSAEQVIESMSKELSTQKIIRF